MAAEEVTITTTVPSRNIISGPYRSARRVRERCGCLPMTPKEVADNRKRPRPRWKTAPDADSLIWHAGTSTLGRLATHDLGGLPAAGGGMVMCRQSCPLSPCPPTANCEEDMGGNGGAQSKRFRAVALGANPEPCTEVEEDGA